MKLYKDPGVVVQVCNPSPQEMKEGKSGVQGQPSSGSTSSLKKKKKEKKAMSFFHPGIQSAHFTEPRCVPGTVLRAGMPERTLQRKPWS